MIGKKILHYNIIEKLGEGGMGIVYLAEDTKLERQVAIKFLPHHLANNSDERKRFEIEAKAAAALNHPNIATIHNIEEADGQLFLVLEYIAGKELKQLMIDDGQLSIEKILEFANQIAEGLAAAHKKGIVHRDIKPANIMIDAEGLIRIMDFGLAKFSGSAQLTQAGTTLGTAAYMSPEQAKGAEVDQRTDIWSFGVVLYEMLTGILPFKGDYEQAVIYSILNEEPEYPDQIPESIKALLQKALAKNPNDRFDNTQDLLAALKDSSSNGKPVIKNSNKKESKKNRIIYAILSSISLILLLLFWNPFSNKQDRLSKNMLVVLPFENLGTAEEDYFAEGITEEITSRLASIKTLGVISRKSALSYRDSEKTLKQIGEELGVNYVLEGTVRWAPGPQGIDRVRITPQLIHVQQDIHVWTDIYERTIQDIFMVQSEIAHKVVTELGITLLESERNTLNKIPTENIEAYHLFLRGKYYLGRPHYSRENWDKGIESFEKAVALDKNFALAYAELAKAHSRLYFVRSDLTPERLAKADHAAQKALQLAKEAPQVHLNLGYYYLWAYRDSHKALREFDIAGAELPNNVAIMRAKSSLYETQGKWQEKVAINERAIELSPRDPSVITDLVFGYWFTRQYQKALETSAKAIAVAPEAIWPYLYVAQINLSFNNPNDESRAALKNVPLTHSFWLWTSYWLEVGDRNFDIAFKLLKNSNDSWMKNKLYVRPKPLLRAFIYDFLDKKEQARAAYDSARISLEQELAKNIDDPRYHSSLGVAYAGLGRKEEAIREGLKAVELLPFKQDAVYGSMFLMDLAAIYAMTSEYELAWEQIDFLLSIPSPVSKAWLKRDVRFKKLYNDPKFNNLP